MSQLPLLVVRCAVWAPDNMTECTTSLGVRQEHEVPGEGVASYDCVLVAMSANATKSTFTTATSRNGTGVTET